MYLVEHVFECRVIVVGVRRRDFVGEERRRVQELHVGLDQGLIEVAGRGLITCGEEEVVRGVHTLIAGVVQVYHRLHVVEEEEKGRKVEPEVEREDQGEETAHMDDYGDGKVHVCVKMKTRQDYLRKCTRRSVDEVSGVRIVRCRASMNVVIGVRVMEFHASIDVVIGIRVVLCHALIDFPLF